jgi:hypothetical protein
MADEWVVIPAKRDGPVVIELPEEEVKPVAMQVEYTPIDYSGDLIVALQKFFGFIDTSSPQLIVQSDDNILGIIPVGSKFEGVEVHKNCLDWQYGTNNWYLCEQELSV